MKKIHINKFKKMIIHYFKVMQSKMCIGRKHCEN